MTNLKIIDLARAARARLFGDARASVTNIVIDSREAAQGSLFVCVIGENKDGHSFAGSAYENGCRAFLMSDAEKAAELMKLHDGLSVILVPDTVKAFTRMAQWYLRLIGAKKIGVTGSVGKTTTKSLSAAVLASKYKVVSSPKNYNTQLGLCMTAFLADPDTEIIVFEMGMDRSGEIDGYCSWLKPDTAVITLIGDSHLEKLGSREAIADAKLEICNYMTTDNALIYNSDSPFLDKYSLSTRTAMNFIPIAVGSRDDAILKIKNTVDHGLAGISFDLSLKDKKLHIRLPLLGKHNAVNAALAASCGLLYDVEPERIELALSEVSGSDRRLAFEDINGLLLLDDSYNASPASMAAALEVLAGIKARRHVAILADMYELGADEESGHIETGKKAGELGINLIIAIGKHARDYARGAMAGSDKISVVSFGDVASAIEKVMSLIGRGDAVLVKGSNATRVGAIAEMIRSLKK